MLSRAVTRLVGLAGVWIGAFVEELLRQLETAHAAGLHRRREPVLNGRFTGPRELMKCRPPLAVALGSAPRSSSTLASS